VLIEGGMTMVLVSHEIGSSVSFGAKIDFFDQDDRLRQESAQQNIGEPCTPHVLTRFGRPDSTAVLLCFFDEA
jgi:ABC-type polar amino acid transport system ATPase subunit